MINKRLIDNAIDARKDKNDKDEEYDENACEVSMDLKSIELLYKGYKYVIEEDAETILASMCKSTTVIGVSATAEINTVIGNYDLDYLSNGLGVKVHKTSKDLKDKMTQYFDNYNKYYSDINVECDIYKGTKAIENIKDYIREFLDERKATKAIKIINSSTKYDFNKKRYANVLRVFNTFNLRDDINSFLYLNTALPNYNNCFNKNVINKLWNLVKKDNASLYYLSSEDYEINKNKIKDALSNGDKILVMSSYKTIGAGQNIQYEIPDDTNIVHLGEYDDNDSRFKSKDYDGIYFGDCTNLTLNTMSIKDKLSARDFLEVLIQIKDLYRKGEIKSIDERDKIINYYKKFFMGRLPRGYNKLQNKHSIKNQATRTFLQACGRINRTLSKNRSILLILDGSLVDKLDKNEIISRAYTPELKAILAKIDKGEKDELDGMFLTYEEYVSNIQNNLSLIEQYG